MASSGSSQDVSGGDDFFGTSFIGHNPYANSTSAYLDQLATLHGMISAQSSGTSPGGQPMGGRMQPNAGGQGSWASPFSDASGTPNIGGSAANAQVNNPTNTGRSGTATGQAVPRTGGAPQYNYSGTNIPQDMQSLRTNLGSYLQQQMNQNGGQQPNYSMLPGSNLFNLGMPMGAQDSYNWANAGPGQINQTLQGGQDTLGNLMGFNANQDFSGLYPALSQLLGGKGPQLSLAGVTDAGNAGMGAAGQFGNAAFGAANQFGQQGVDAATQYGQGAVQSAGMYGQNAMNAAGGFAGQAGSAFNASMPFAQNIAATGGAPIQQLLSSLTAIQNQGQNAIEGNLAQIRERYGAQGLGQGSDVNQALALGATTGQAQIESQQSSLLTQILQQAAQTQLGGVNALQGAGSGLGSLGGMLGGTALGAGNLLSGAANTAGGLISGANANIGSLLSNSALGAGGLMSGAANNMGNLQLGAQGLNLNAQSTGINAMLGALNPGLNILQQPVQNQLSSAGIQLGATGQMPGYANAYNTAFSNAAQGNLGVANLNQQANMYTNNAQYQNFVRQTQQLPPAIQAALGFGTAFPPVNNQPSTGAALGAGGLSAFGSILGALISAGVIFA